MQRRKTNDNAVDRCRLARVVSNIINCGVSTGEPRFTLESSHLVDVGRLPTQHLSDGSYYAIVNLVLREERRHPMRVQRGRGRRTQIGHNNQIVNDVDDVERHCGKRAVRGTTTIVATIIEARCGVPSTPTSDPRLSEGEG